VFDLLTNILQNSYVRFRWNAFSTIAHNYLQNHSTKTFASRALKHTKTPKTNELFIDPGQHLLS